MFLFTRDVSHDWIPVVALRTDQVELTRRRITDTVFEMSTEPESGPISVAEVARRSGISPATIYRHFPNREALVNAAANARVTMGIDDDDRALGIEDQRARLLALWSDLAQMLNLVRQATVSEAGRELRAVRFAGFKPLLDQAIADAGVDPDSAEGRRLGSCLHVLQSAHAFLDLHDRQGLSVDAAVDAVVWGMETLYRSVGIDPASLFLTLPAPPDEETTT
jgi:AcrR family transcriptional regulator